jgi:hypothetical protein
LVAKNGKIVIINPSRGLSRWSDLKKKVNSSTAKFVISWELGSRKRL